MSYIVAGIGYCDEDDFATCEYCCELFPVDELGVNEAGVGVCEQCLKEG
jgi:hypothetical protein